MTQELNDMIADAVYNTTFEVLTAEEKQKVAAIAAKLRKVA